MLSFKTLVLSLLSTAVVAVPTPQTTGVNDPNYLWQVSGWTGSCARSGCYYDFNITGPAYGSNPAIPAFSAYCSGGPAGQPFKACNILDNGAANRGVAAKLLPAETGTGAHIEVSFQWTASADTYYNYTGDATASYNQAVAPAESFTIEPSSAVGAA